MHVHNHINNDDSFHYWYQKFRFSYFVIWFSEGWPVSTNYRGLFRQGSVFDFTGESRWVYYHKPLPPLINTRIDINEHNALLFPFHIISKIPFLAEIDTGSFAHYRHRFSTPGTPWPIPLNKMWYSIDIGLVHFVR